MQRRERSFVLHSSRGCGRARLLVLQGPLVTPLVGITRAVISPLRQGIREGLNRTPKSRRLLLLRAGLYLAGGDQLQAALLRSDCGSAQHPTPARPRRPSYPAAT